ncbi:MULTISPECIES: alpha/beta hydrolase [Streptomyces]|uniref:alpha/beta hydrolase n=1 Tax=Streptomyces TaxID=1883 RepID=UPI0026ABA63C|nr:MULTISPECIES: alpha/beta hydrolase [Streptomyces]
MEAPAGRLHLVEQGSGPLVLLVHGFPESWYSWRRQLPALAAAGYRAVALDVRGYGRSSKPAAVDAYRMLELVEDNVAVVRALGAENAVVIGHDWGSHIAATSALLHPEVFRAVGLLSVPYAPPGGPRPTDTIPTQNEPDPHFVAHGGQLRDRFPAGVLPAWPPPTSLTAAATGSNRNAPRKPTAPDRLARRRHAVNHRAPTGPDNTPRRPWPPRRRGRP